MRAWKETLADVTAASSFTPIDARNLGDYNATWNDSGGTVPASSPYKLTLDQRPKRGTVSITLDAVAASLIEWPSTPSTTGIVAVNYVTGELEFHSADAGKTVAASYKYLGTAFDATWLNQIQKNLAKAQSDITDLGGGGLVPLAKGGTHADLSATGPGVLLQAGVGADVTVGTVSDSYLSAAAQDAVTKRHSQNTDTGTTATTFTFASGTNIAGASAVLSFGGAAAANVTINDSLFTFDLQVESSVGFSGDGSALTSLDASQLTTGTVADARLSANVALLDTAQTATAKKTFSPTTTSSADFWGAVFGAALNHTSGVMANGGCAYVGTATKSGAGTVTNAANLYIAAAPAFASTGNYSVWAAGAVRVDAVLSLPSATSSSNYLGVGTASKVYEAGGNDLQNWTSRYVSWRKSGGGVLYADLNSTSVNLLSTGQITVSPTGGFVVNSTSLGFFNTAAVARPAAYTQSYATASRAHSAYTSDPESSVYTGIDNAQAGSVYAQLTDLNALRTAYENVRASHENTKQVLNQLLDDLQAYGLLQ